ncbi:MAG: NfeD family protein [Dehalococcoidia bacterium]
MDLLTDLFTDLFTGFSMTATEMTGPIVLAIVLAVGFIALAVYAIIRAHKQKISAGVEDMLGKEAVVRTTLQPKGTVLAEGELWSAIAEGGRIEAGEEVIITKIEGLRLMVKKKDERKEGQ